MARITPTEALQRASSAEIQGMRLAAAKNKSKKSAAIQPEFVGGFRASGSMTQIYPEECPLYLYKQGTDGIILPAYDDIMPVLGEAEQAGFTDDLPPALTDWLKGYAQEIEGWQNDRLIDLDGNGEPLTEEAPDGEAEANSQSPTANGQSPTANGQSPTANSQSPTANSQQRVSVATLCKAVWGQGSPYNKNLVFDGEVCKVGCWAVAVGIIMQYWGTMGYRRGCTATNEYKYSGNPHTIAALPPLAKFDYQNITPTKPSTAAQKNAVAVMLQYIGAACKQRYAEDVTTAWIDRSTPFLASRLRLGSGIKAVSDTSVGAAKFEQMVYDEIALGRPVILRGARQDGSGGHFFVADGYNASTQKYHINWGWDGRYNGNFALSALTPLSGYDYTFGKWVIKGIMPEYKLGDVNRDGIVNITDAMKVIDHSLKGTFDEAADVNSDGKVTVADHTPIINQVLGKESL